MLKIFMPRTLAGQDGLPASLLQSGNLHEIVDYGYDTKLALSACNDTGASSSQARLVMLDFQRLVYEALMHENPQGNDGQSNDEDNAGHVKTTCTKAIITILHRLSETRAVTNPFYRRTLDLPPLTVVLSYNEPRDPSSSPLYKQIYERVCHEMFPAQTVVSRPLGQADRLIRKDIQKHAWSLLPALEKAEVPVCCLGYHNDGQLKGALRGRKALYSLWHGCIEFIFLPGATDGVPSAGTNSKPIEQALTAIMHALGVNYLPPDKLSRHRQLLESAGTEIAGTSASMDRLCHDLWTAARTPNAHVLILGETGTGKELCAEAIHRATFQGSRKERPYRIVNCAGFTAELIDSQLFGHVAEAFTGATKDKVGHIKKADGGTLFLDEIQAMPLDTLAKLLRFMEDGKFYKLGGDVTDRAKVRIIAATNSPDFNMKIASTGNERVQKLRESGFLQRFQFTIETIPLNQHREDIPELTTVLLARLNAEHDLNIPQYRIQEWRDQSGAFFESLKYADWSNRNVRGLETVLLEWLMMRNTDTATLRAGSGDHSPKGGVDTSSSEVPADDSSAKPTCGRTRSFTDVQLEQALDEALKWKKQRRECNLREIKERLNLLLDGNYRKSDALRRRVNTVKDNELRSQLLGKLGILWPNNGRGNYQRKTSIK